MNSFKYVINRRRELKGRLNLETDIEKWAETCLPSYCHSNIFAAYVSWLRLFEAVNFFEKALQKSVFFSSKQTTNNLQADKTPEKKSYKIEIILVIILIFLLGILALTFLFRNSILSFLS